MSTTLVIASRELREKSRLLIVCAAAAVLPFLAALLPASRGDRPTVIGAVSGFLAIAFCLGTAIAQGSSTIGRELSDKRLSFYFTKPVSPAAIWIGKAAASLLISMACFAIITLPAYLAVREEWRTVWMMRGLVVPLVVLVGAVVLFFVSHAMGTMIRSRSALIGVDFLLAAATVGVVILLARPVILGMAGETLALMGNLLAYAIVGILAVAPVWQLAKGRTDVRQSHAALSKFLWTAIAALLLVAAAYVGWLVSFSPAAIKQVSELEPSQGSDWVFVSGTSPSRGDYHGSFLINTTSGQSDKVNAPPGWGAQFSRNGKVAAWVEPATFVPHANHMEIYTRRLDVPGAKAVTTNIRGPVGSGFVLSDDGSRLAVHLGRTIAVHDVATGKLLAAVAVDQRSRSRMFFVGTDVVRLMGVENGPKTARLRIAELDVTKKSLTRTADIEVPKPGMITVSGDGSRAMLHRANLVVDGRTGAPVMTLSAPSGVWGSAVLADGRVVSSTTDGARAHVRYFSRDGQPLGEVVLPTKHAWVSAELSDGKVVLMGYPGPGYSATGQNRTMFVVDGKSIVRTIPNVKGPSPTWNLDPRLPRFDASRNLTGVDATGALVLWNPRTGETKRPG